MRGLMSTLPSLSRLNPVNSPPTRVILTPVSFREPVMSVVIPHALWWASMLINLHLGEAIITSWRMTKIRIAVSFKLATYRPYFLLTWETEPINKHISAKLWFTCIITSIKREKNIYFFRIRWSFRMRCKMAFNFTVRRDLAAEL